MIGRSIQLHCLGQVYRPITEGMRLGLNGLETGDAGITTRTRFSPVCTLVQARTQ